MNLDTFLEIIKKADLPEIKKLCESNKTFNAYCKENKEYIYRQLIKRDFPGRETESEERKYKRLLNYKEGKVLPLDEWYMGKDQSYRFAIASTYEIQKVFDQVLQTNPNVNKEQKNSAPLLYAIKFGTPKQIYKLLEMGANVNVKNNANWTALMMSMRYSTPQVTNKLLEMGAGDIDINIINSQSWTQLMISIKNSTPEITNKLLDKNADVNVKSDKGFTPLMMAIQESTPNIAPDSALASMIHKLLDMGSDVNAKSNKGTAVLSLALQFCPPEIINRLLDMGADINTPGYNNTIPLMYAIPFSTPEIINRLLDMNVEVHAKDLNGLSVLRLAQEHSTPSIVARIRELAAQQETCQVASPEFDDIFGTIHDGKLRVNTKKDDKWRRWKCETICREQLIKIAQGVGITDPVGSKKELCNSIQEALENTGRMR